MYKLSITLLAAILSLGVQADTLTITGGGTTGAWQSTGSRTINENFDFSSYSGTIIYDGSGNITGGILSGSSSNELEYFTSGVPFGDINLRSSTWDLATGFRTGGYNCDGLVLISDICNDRNPGSFNLSLLSTDFINLAAGTGTIQFDALFSGGDSTTFNFDGTVSTVPVPAAALLFGSALLGLAGIKRART